MIMGTKKVTLDVKPLMDKPAELSIILFFKLSLIKDRLMKWLRQENLILTIIKGEAVTNGKMLSIANGVLSGCFLVFAPSAECLITLGLCFVWFTLSLFLCKKIKK